MIDKLVMLTGVSDETYSGEYTHTQIPLDYERARRLWIAIQQVRKLQGSGLPDIAAIVIAERENVTLVSDPDFQTPYGRLGPLSEALLEHEGGYFVRPNFVLSPSARVKPVPSRATVTSSGVFWSASINGIEYQSSMVAAHDLLRALCILAPADEVVSYFRELVEAGPIVAADCLMDGGFFIDEPNYDVVRPLPSFSKNDWAWLLSHEIREIREAAIAALRHLEMNSRPPIRTR